VPRPIWKGQISFGLVNVPVVLFPAEQSAGELNFNLLDKRDHARVKYKRVNASTGEEVPWNQIVKGYEYEEGNFVEVTDKDFERAAVEQTKTVAIEDFIAADDLDWLYIDKPYYLAPDKRGDKGYVLLRETLKKTKQVGIARVVLRAREHLAALTVRDEALVVLLLRFAQELRDPAEFNLPSGDLKTHRITDKELKIASELVKAMSGKWNPEKYHDEYSDTLRKWIEKKAEAGGVTPAPEKSDDEAAPRVVNIMKLLQQSLQERAGGRKSPRAAATSSSRRTASRKIPRARRKGA
jgi:DNA end-binding protein Ku